MSGSNEKQQSESYPLVEPAKKDFCNLISQNRVIKGEEFARLFSTAMARIRPPMNITLTDFMYSTVVELCKKESSNGRG